MIHLLTQHLLLRYMTTLQLCQLWGIFLSPAKRNCIVDTTQNKLYRALSLHISSDNIKAAHKSSAYHLTQTKPIEGRGSGKFLNSPNIFPRTDP